MERDDLLMKWSRYNIDFKSERNGWLLYNSYSNSFVKLDDMAAELIQKVKVNPDFDFSRNPELYFKLRFGGFLVEDGKDDDSMRIQKMKRLISNYSTDSLFLTMALTRACNFDCHYCYEHDRIISSLSDETVDDLISFIERHKSADKLHITWYGGEPLLEFDRLVGISKRVVALKKNYSSSMITNGYLLTDEVVAVLNELKISFIQITIDGLKEVHDSRRHLVGGGTTYDQIVTNIENLVNSDWSGTLHLRVNVDKSNRDEFVHVYRVFEEKYPEKLNSSIIVAPGFVHDYENPCNEICLNSDEKGNFLLGLVKEHNIIAEPVFPKAEIGSCVLVHINSYVVGPDGELYKCWEDVGKNQFIVGNLKKPSNQNVSLLAEGMVGASYINDEACMECFLSNVCSGGCPKARMYSNRDGIKRDVCSHYKNHIAGFLEIHYEQKKAKPNL